MQLRARTGKPSENANAFAGFIEKSVATYADVVLNEVEELVIATPWPDCSSCTPLRHRRLSDNVLRSVYMSREARTRNSVMATVRDSRKRIALALLGVSVDTAFEFDPGNHFIDAASRLVRGYRVDPVSHSGMRFRLCTSRVIQFHEPSRPL